MLKKMAILAGVLAASSVYADANSGAYVGAGVGTLTYKENDVGFDADDTAFKVFGGYRFNPYIAVEAAFIDGGAPSQVIFGQTIEVELSALTVNAVGSIPLGTSGFGLFGEIGVASWEATARNRTFGIEMDDDGSDITYGLGAQFDFKFPLRLRAEYQTIDVSEADVDLLTVSAAYRF